MYPLHLSYTTTPPSTTITTKITIFHMGTFLEHPDKGVGKLEGSPALSQNFMNFGPQNILV